MTQLKYFYKIVDDKVVRGSGTKIPEGMIEYQKGNEPQELVDMLNKEAEAKRLVEEAKQIKADKIKAINEIVVEVNGKQFQADDGSRANMQEAITAAGILEVDKTNWKLADNTIVEVTLDELKEALAKGIQAKGKIILGE